MIKGDKTVVRSLRRAVREQVNASPALSRERRRVKQSWWRKRRQMPYFPRILISFFLLDTLGKVLGQANDRTETAAYCALGIWALLVTFTRTTQIKQAFSNYKDLTLPFQLPVANETAFDQQNHQVLLSSCWLVLDFLVVGVVYASMRGTTAVWLAIVPFAIAQGALSLALGWIIIQWCPKSLYRVLGLGLYGLGFTVFIYFAFGRSQMLALLSGPLATFISYTPAGWLLMGWQMVVGGIPAGWIMLVIVPVLSMSAYFAYRTQRAAFQMETVFDYDGLKADEALEKIRVKKGISTATANTETPPTNFSPEQATHITEVLRKKLQEPILPVLNSDPLMRRILGRILTNRQKVLLEVMQANPVPSWKRWVKSLIVVLSARFILPWFWPSSDFEQVVQVITYAVAGFMLLPTFSESWQGFGVRGAFQINQSIYAQYPVKVTELAKLYCQMGWLRCLAAWPFLALALVLAVPVDVASRTTVVAVSMKIIFCFMLAQSWSFNGAISKSTNDTQRLAWSAVGLSLGGLLALLSLLGLTIWLFAASSLWANLTAAVIMNLICAAAFFIYVHFYNKPSFDLVRQR